MEVGDVAAWFAAGVAIIAAVIAMSNANSAKTQAGAALKQASEAQKAREAAEAQVKIAEAAIVEARRSAAAAEEQARAAVEQLAILRKQVDEQRVEKDTPRFDITRPSFSGEDMVPIDINMVAGMDLRSITVTVTGTEVDGFSVDPLYEMEGGEPIVYRDAEIGFETTVWVGLHETLDTSIVVRIDCEAADGRTWTRQQPMRLMHQAIRNYGH